MAKTNFTKVEGMLDEGLRKMNVEQLLNLTKPNKSDQSAEQPNKERLKTLLTLQRDLKFLDKADQEPYELFNITKKRLNKLIKNPETTSPEEWAEIKETQMKVNGFRKEFEKNGSNEKNDELIQQQIRQHKTKRFNINDKWLPLT